MKEVCFFLFLWPSSVFVVWGMHISLVAYELKFKFDAICILFLLDQNSPVWEKNCMFDDIVIGVAFTKFLAQINHCYLN